MITLLSYNDILDFSFIYRMFNINGSINSFTVRITVFSLKGDFITFLSQTEKYEMRFINPPPFFNMVANLRTY